MRLLHTPKKNKGLTILEVVMYFGLMAVLTIVVMDSLFSLFKSYASIRAGQDLETTAIQVLDRMTRDIHDADSVVVNQSSFDIPAGYVTLAMNAAGTETIKYTASSSRIAVEKDGTYLGHLSLATIIVNNFNIKYINGTSTQALKIELGLTAPVRNASTTVYKNFYTTVQLRD